MRFDRLFAQRTGNMAASAIREILKVASQPGMISLAGGVPAPESFPLEILRELTARVIDQYPAAAFQYGPTEGFPPLREAIASRLCQAGIDVDGEGVLITSGSQGVLDGLGKVLISEGDEIAVEAPTYLGALQAFNPYCPRYVKLGSDDEGLIPASLERALKEHRLKFVYVVPNFQNPTGKTIPLERRRQIAALIREHDALLVEDDPYSSLRYEGESLPTLKSMAPDHVAYVGSLSKVLAPGLRLGYVAAPEPLAKWLVIAKQGIDLHTSSFNQALAAEYLTGGYLDRHLPKIVEIYKPKLQAMLQALARHFPSECCWSRPEGGMFVWVEGPKGLNMEDVYRRTVARKTAFVPGRFFFVENGEGGETMRLNFTMADEEAIDRAVRIIAEEIEAGMRTCC
jgi:2-aminoadipate transaminase